MSEEQNPFWLVGRATLGTGAQVTITKNSDAPSVIPSPLEAIERASKQARAELRDRFAMAVVSGVYLHWRTSLDREQLWVDFQDIAEMAYGVADAMLKARGDE